eukprot:TRINITY_DN5291_c0_g1_i1.p1 TRINITY_DN5291_c0_g1~~TRINITY_DN5291_c0_g1_i1.p1  ORF type:complete len:458 (-),score=98.78 TRINITY_DN5291_c0_g1_i1:35-1324(-)
MKLPGWTGALPSRHFSGYLQFDKTKHMHYWLVESENDPVNDPVIVWLNGGPGCSSLDGFIYEHGPFRIDPTDPTHSRLVKFEYTWSKMANVIYLESPVGVGFSYSTNPEDYITDDDKSSQDNLHAVEAFFNAYPRFKKNKFFIAGESYGGVYVPTLAEAIMWATRNGTYTGPKLEGIAVGNGCSGSEIGVCGNDRTKYDMLYFLQTALLSEKSKEEIRSACGDFSNISPKCNDLVTKFGNTVGNINIYNIYGDCIDGSPQHVLGKTASKIPRPENYGGPDWCIDSVAASAYFNRPDVMAAIHVKKPPFVWSVCANQLTYNQSRPNLPRDTYPALNEFVRVVVYNGDWDACVPYTDAEAWTTGMNYPVISEWQPWYFPSPEKQVGGYATVYKSTYNFTFITVKGGRHEVPETAPRQAFEMIRRLLAGESF